MDKENSSADSALSEEQQFRKDFRVVLKRWSKNLYWIALWLGLFLADIQAVLRRGESEALFWTPISVYLLSLAALARRRRWLLALIGVLSCVAFIHVFHQAALLFRAQP